jgi:hypothetical protein
MALVFAGCGGQGAGAPSGPTRAFRMGLTPFAQGVDAESVDRTWDFVLGNGDLLAIHIDPFAGLPWEALERDEPPAPLRESLDAIAARRAGKTLYVAINPLNGARDGVAPNTEGGPFPESLGPAEFSNPRLRQAFLNYARLVVETLEPTYLAIGIEVNMYDLAPEADFASLVDLHKEVYRDLKSTHPSLIIFATFQTEFMHGFGQWGLLSRFEPELDRVGLSLYPSGVGFRPDDIPADWINAVRWVSNRPIVITETGYGTQPFEGTDFSAPGSDALQREYLEWLVAKAEEAQVEFVVWFFPSDVPDVLEGGGTDPPEFDNVGFYLHMGLVREDFSEKPSLELWNRTVRRPLEVRPPNVSRASEWAPAGGPASSE